jgi:hypothetical protein
MSRLGNPRNYPGLDHRVKRGTIMRWWQTTPLLGLLAMFTACSEEKKKEETPTLEVWLNGDVSEIKGLGKEWPVLKDGLSSVTAVQSPHWVIVHLPSERSFKSWSKLTILRQEHHRVVDVNVIPVSASTTWADCIDKIENAAASIDLLDESDLQERIEMWKKETAPKSDVSGLSLVEERVDMFVTVSSKPDSKLWYCTVEFNYLDEESWKRLLK